MNKEVSAKIESAPDDLSDEPGVLQLFADQVLHDAEATAISFGEASLSYGELDRRANQLAHHLLTAGVKRGDIVALCLSRSMEMIVGMLGILKTGAAYLPMDIAYPRERLAFMLEDADVGVVLTLSGDREALPGTSARVICLDAESEGVARERQDAPGVDHDPDALAYVIYTSGSTGKPKGCQVTHRNLSWFFSASADRFDFTSQDVWTFVLSQAFDVSGFEIWGALTHGARLVVVPRETVLSPSALRGLLLRERITVICQTPTAFLQLMRCDEGLPHEEFALRYVILGGEALALQSLRPWLQRHGDRQPRLVNMYGPTETTIYVTSREIAISDLDRGAGSVIGTGLPGVELYVLDDQLRRVPVGTEGELCVGGVAVTLGYLKRPEANARQFIEWCDPSLAQASPQRLYRTGDVVRELPDGDIEYLGRSDHQVKLNGFRIELGEIEATLARHPAVRACTVLARDDPGSGKRLVAYVVPRDAMPPVDLLRSHLAMTLPEFMVPAAFVALDAFPQNANGKLDRSALPAPGRRRPELSREYEPPADIAEQHLCDAFAELLQIDGIGRHDNFFDLGGNSLLATRLLERLGRDRREPGAGDAKFPTTLLFQHPTPAALARALDANADDAPLQRRMPRSHRAGAAPRPSAEDGIDEPIAIVAMAGRFPGANDVEAFWKNLCEGRDSITRFRTEDLDPAVSAADRSDPTYVAARGVIDGVEDFDAAFFGISQKEAELTDPQHRIFLELCWECLERAGHVPDETGVPVGVFAGMYDGSYMQKHLMPRPDLIRQAGALAVSFLNEKDYFATRVAHKLNLTGPAISVQTACSTSLVAICQAVDSLRAGQCDMALAGGASVTCPPRSGYLYQEGTIFSSDGRTRTFDSSARGTVFSDGATVVLLKRLSDAQADGNPVYAVIRGGAVNNDGGGKASFIAPSSDGQAAVIEMAHRNARVDPRSISYVEAHGTGTPVGDPIELQGLTKAFRRGTAETGFCRIGSVKSNVGHLVIAAGGAGLIKTAMALAERRIPASLHFESPNPYIDFAASPFVVNTSLSEWPDEGVPRRAGVSSFGVGGTNAHAVLEEAPAAPRSDPASGPQLLVLSARTPAALAQACTRLADHLQAEPESNLADVAWTLAAGRKTFKHRFALVADDVDNAIAGLRNGESTAGRSSAVHRAEPVFLFPGQGATYAGMGRGLYQDEPVFRAAIDECARILGKIDVPAGHRLELRERIFSDDPGALLPTSVMQPATFAIEYALALWWLSLGLMPAAMVGHSVGEFVAATLAGVFSLPDALRLVARRGALMQAQPGGSMLSVRLPADLLRQRLPADLSLAAENAPGACVIAGPDAAVLGFQSTLESEGVACRLLRTSHAFHSQMMEPVVEPFLAEVRSIRLSAPQLPLVSTATGDWLDAASATSPEYWASHLRRPVQFSAALGRIAEMDGATPRVLLEVGPRGSLCTLARQHPGVRGKKIAAVESLDDEPCSETSSTRIAAGRLWAHGVPIDPGVFDRRKLRQRIRLPTYPFQRQRLWIEAAVSDPDISPLAVGRSARGAGIGPTPPASSVAEAGKDEAVEPRVRYLAQVWSEMLGGEVTADDNFFELGGHSMLAVQMVNRVALDTGVRIKLIRLGAENLAQIASALPEMSEPTPLPGIDASSGFGLRLRRLFGLRAADNRH